MTMPFKPRPRGRKALILAAIENSPGVTNAAVARRFDVSPERVRRIRIDGGLPQRRVGRPARAAQETGGFGANG